MRKSLLAATATSLFVGLAHAQSSVTLYGIIDEGLNYNSNAGGHRQYNMLSGVMAGSRWGLRGTEDLGGGLTAIFTLENGYNLSNGQLGQGGLEFGRQAFVGLSSPYGTVTIGRQYDSVVNYIGPFIAGDQWGGYMVSHPGDIDNTNNEKVTNNAIKFKSVPYGGLTFGGVYSFGGVAGKFTQNQIYSLGVGYTNGPLSLGAAYLNVKNPNVSFYGTSISTALTPGAQNNIVSPVNAGYASAQTLQVIAAAGAYQFGAATFGAVYTNTEFKSLSGVPNSLNPAGLSGTGTMNNVEINLKYQITPAFLLGLAYDYLHSSSVSGHDGANYNQFNFGLDYFLSKRTDVYAIAVYQHASGTQSNGATAVATIALLTPSNSDRQTAVRIGIRHNF